MDKPQVAVVHRLSQDAYDQLAKTVPGPAVDNEVSAHRAGYLLGIQHILQKLREGFVV